MIVCPDCGHDNIPGADACEQCQQPLTVTEVEPASLVEKSIAEDTIEILRPKPPLTVSPETPVGQVLDVLVENSIGCVLITEGDEVIGIFTERDALFRLGPEAPRLADRPVSAYMTPSPQSLARSDKIAFALHRMALGGYRHIPIHVDGKTTGIISIRDIFRYITERLVAS